LYEVADKVKHNSVGTANNLATNMIIWLCDISSQITKMLLHLWIQEI